MSADPLREFLDVMRELRVGCSWKAAQTHRSLVRYLLEETHETIEAIETGTPEDLCEELGDVLLQVWFHAVIAEEAGDFTLDDVARGILEKMYRRNPHVFGDAPGGTAEEVDARWREIKRAEKGREDVMEGLPASLPALLYADKVARRLGREAMAEVGAATGGADAETDAGRIGEALLAVVVEAKDLGVDPEQALRDAVRRRLADRARFDPPAARPGKV